MGRFDSWRCRCSSLGALMTEPKTKEAKEAGDLSETAKTMLVKEFIRERYGRKKELENKYITKGTKVEEDGITIISKALGVYISKNRERRHNNWLEGECDYIFTLEGKNVIGDNKARWDIFTFHDHYDDKIDKKEEWQLRGYMWLWEDQNVENAFISSTLVNTPEWLIEKELRSLEYKVSPDAYEDAAKELLSLMRYDDIHYSERFIIQAIEKDEKMQESIIPKVEKAREYLEFLWHSKEKLNYITNKNKLS